MKGVSFRVEKGEVLGFLGPNGAGKTTTMRILTCFFPPTGGSARVAGFDVFEQSREVRKRLGYLPESVPLYRDMVAEEYLTFTAAVKGVPAGEVKKRVDRVMDECAITHMRKKIIGEMSKGYRQRVGLAQALVNDPEVLILDEPTIGLDPKQIIGIRQLIKDLGGRRTVILSTHILPEVSMVCQRVVIINEGRVIAEDTPGNLTRGIDSAARMVLKVDGPAAEVGKAVKGINGVESVEAAEGQEGDPVREYAVLLEKDKDVRREIAARVVNGGWGLIEMKPVEMSLEDIFVKLVTKE
ncbi:MAG: ATP-binding cassette domain-containing protein [Thermodesulfobacteriota bacterium]